MKGKLIKTDDEYRLYLDDVLPYATSDNSPYKRLSVQNCDEIFGVVDVNKLAKNSYIEHHKNDLSLDELIQRSGGFIVGFKEGFNEAMSLNKDKLFTVEDIKKVITITRNDTYKRESVEEIIQSLRQPTEIDVEIVMDKIPADLAPGGWDVFPKLDAQGCLILKKL